MKTFCYKSRSTILTRILFIDISIVFLFFFSCEYPVDPEERDIVALERIWQYCKAFSLYTERVPAHERLLEFDSPSELVDSIYDTLHNWVDIFYFVAEYYPSGKNVKLMRNSGYNPFTAIRSDGAVYYKKLTDSTAYLSIKDFWYSVNYDLVPYNDSVITLSNIIIDLRGNPGGLVDTCIKIIEYFLSDSIPYLSVTYRKISSDIGIVDTGIVENDTLYSYTSGNVWEGKKVVFLIDYLTASAAEIFTVALRDGLPQGYAYIIGQKSFGKAIGQVIFQLLNNAGLKITTMKFLPINGVSYHEKGINPDVSDSLLMSTIFPDIPLDLIPPDTIFKYELLEAGKWFETDFEDNVDSFALDKVIADNSVRQKYHDIGCYKIIKAEELPDF